jgi:hypothetical protein
MLWHVRWKTELFDQRKLPLLGYGTIGSDVIMQYLKLCHVTYFFNPILFAICTSTFSKLRKNSLQWYVEKYPLALLCK